MDRLLDWLRQPLKRHDLSEDLLTRNGPKQSQNLSSVKIVVADQLVRSNRQIELSPAQEVSLLKSTPNEFQLIGVNWVHTGQNTIAARLALEVEQQRGVSQEVRHQLVSVGFDQSRGQHDLLSLREVPGLRSHCDG